MSLLAAFVAHEARIQARSLRFRLLVAAYAVLGSAPAFLVYLARREGAAAFGAATFASAVASSQPILTSLLAAILSVDAAIREREERSFDVVGLAPMTNSGYLLRRWAAVEAIVLLLTVVPPASAAALALLSGCRIAEPGPFIWPWLLHVVPLSAAASASGIALGTIAGGIIPGTLLFFLLTSLPLEIGNDLLARYGRHIGGPGEWVGLDPQVVGALSTLIVFYPSYMTPATEAPYDATAAASFYAAQGCLALGAAALVLAASAAFLRRTRRNVRPWRIRQDHPLRTFLRWVNRLREEQAPDPHPAAADRLVFVTGIVLCAGAAVSIMLRGEHYRARAEARYLAEISGGPAPTDVSLVPGRWRITGEIERGGAVHLQVSGTMLNRGARPISHAAFSLSPPLRVERASADGAALRWSAERDRVSAELEPPIDPGAEVKLEFEIEGVPGEERLYFFQGSSFALSFETFREARLANYLQDLSRSYRVRAISPRRVSLDATDLTPVPRYTPWILTPKSEQGGGIGMIVPEETIFPPARIEIDLRTPTGLFLADSCGDVARAEGSAARLAGGCRLPLQSLAIRGGDLEPIPGIAGIGALAVLHTHEERARLHAPALSAAAALARRAWPGLDPLGDRVVIESPPAFHPDPRAKMDWRPFNAEMVSDSPGRLLLIPEAQMASASAILPEPMATAAVATDLAARRPALAEEQYFFLRFFEALARFRLGTGRGALAAISEHKEHVRAGELKTPILTAPRWYYEAVWRIKLPAIVADVAGRVGSAKLAAGVEEFLSSGGGAPGSVKDLLDAIARVSGVSMDRTYADYFTGDALPILSFEDIRVVRSGATWETRGAVRNLGSGLAICPVVVRTEMGPVSADVRVEGGAAARFLLNTRETPRAVLLDPEKRCFRYQPRVGTVERVELGGKM